MMERLIAELGEKLDLTAEELADIIWLTLMRQQNTIPDRPSKIETPPAIAEVPPAETVELPPPVVSGAIEPQPTTANKPQTTTDKPKTTADKPQNNAEKPQTTADRSQKNAEPEIGIAPRRSQTNPFNCLPIKVANPPSIRDPLALVRSLRPLMRQVPAGQIEGLDESATARQIAESGIWQPMVKPVLEPWWDVVLVADESASMSIWRQTVLEFRQLLRNYGAFRDVQLWGLYGAEEKAKGKRPCLRPGIGSEALKSAPRQPEEILDPSGRRLIVLISDCVAACWQDEALIEMLGLWSKHSPVAIAQVLPQWLWVRTACRGFELVQLTALEPGVSNSQLVVDWSGVWEAESERKTGVCVPIVPLEPDAILTWSQMVMGHSEAPGYWVRSSSIEPQPSETASLSPQQCVEQFQVMSSPAAQRLMGLVAASPVIALPVIRLIQETMLPESRQMNVAEVLLGGLLEPINPPKEGANPDEVEYRFVDEAIRDLLLAQTPVPDTVSVLSKFVERQFHKSLDEFVAQLQVSSKDVAKAEKARSFATVTASVLKRKGGKYRELVDSLQNIVSDPPSLPYQAGVNLPAASNLTSFPPLQEFDFETAKIVFEEEEIQPSQRSQPLQRSQPSQRSQPLQPFEFEMATVKLQRKRVVINRERRQAWGYAERLSKTVELEMVAIPEGQFQMGSPKNEPERFQDESPQHQVSVLAFFMGKYPVTQVQWQAVAKLPKIRYHLESNPSRFKRRNRPVECVSWYDAVEFCARLSQKTGKIYRLPSEAEWEYACRAETTTPFHFGETITTDLANYDGSYINGAGSTKPVGSFGVANAFGLYDMHGNVWEWCVDPWHSNYQGAPNDGTVWDDSCNDNRYLNCIDLLVNTAKENQARLLRGGSWNDIPRNCRSAIRYNFNAPDGNDLIGFRVVCVAAWT